MSNTEFSQDLLTVFILTYMITVDSILKIWYFISENAAKGKFCTAFPIQRVRVW